MSRVYLDTMVWIYWFDRGSPHHQRAARLVVGLRNHPHTLLSSLFVEGELLVFPVREHDEFTVAAMRRYFREGGLQVVAFDDDAVIAYAEQRARRIKSLDALHLAVAARAKVDFFLTEDQQLQRLSVRGIGRILGMDAVTL